jgi:hypothetical protein
VVSKTADEDRSKAIRCLADILKLESKPVWETSIIPIRQINHLTQTRKTYKAIDRLSANMEVLGNLEPMLVVSYDKAGAEAYIATINEEWGTGHEIDELVSFEADRYLIVIAGHSRLMALQNLGEEMAEVRLTHDLPPFEALFVQMSENLHQPVPKVEEATGRIRLFRMIQRRQPTFSFEQYAPHVGVSVDQLRDEAKFINLPEAIQRLAEVGYISFTLALEFDRLIKLYDLDGLINQKIRESFADHVAWRSWLIDYCLTQAIIERYSVDQFKRQFEYELKMELNRQLSFFDLDESITKKRNFKKAIVNRSIDGIRGAIKYLSSILDLFGGEQALLRSDESPLLDRAFRAMFLELLKLIEKTIPHLRFLRDEEAKRAIADVQEAANLCSEIDKLTGRP